jgi:hypothetical protein
VRRHDVEAELVGAVRVRTALAQEGELRAVGRPGGVGLAEATRREALDGARPDIEHVEVSASGIEVSGSVFLEVEAVDHDGQRSSSLVLGIGAEERIVLNDQRYSRSVRGPVIVEDIALEEGHLARVATPPIEQPEGVRRVLGSAG